MTPKAQFAALGNLVAEAQLRYTQCRDNHYREGRSYDTPGPTLDALGAASQNLKASLDEAREACRQVFGKISSPQGHEQIAESRKIGRVTIIDHPEYSSVSFVSAKDLRAKANTAAQFRAWGNSRA